MEGQLIYWVEEEWRKTVFLSCATVHHPNFCNILAGMLATICLVYYISTANIFRIIQS